LGSVPQFAIHIAGPNPVMLVVIQQWHGILPLVISIQYGASMPLIT